MSWLSPLDRREITLLLLCIVVYILAYNLETSLQLLGVDSVATSGAVFSRIGLGKTRTIDRDGRKPNGWRDNLELEIYGNWEWDQGHVAGNGDERTQKVGTGQHGAAWVGRAEARDLSWKPFGEVSVDQAIQRWRDDVPLTKVIKHNAGYTILDNVFVFNGGVYLVSDDLKDFPPIAAIVSSTGPGFGPWSVLSKQQAFDLFGGSGGVIRGVSWMAADTDPHNSTLLSLWRTYCSLDPTIDSEGRTKLPPPQRLIFPHNPFFSDPDPAPEADSPTIRRRRVDTGFHPYLAKAAFPYLTVMYSQDFEDYAKIRAPFMFERLVIADRLAASQTLDPTEPEFLPAFELETSKFWWEPVRKTMASFLDLDSSPDAKKKAMTYIVTQDNAASPKLRSEDHEKLVSALKRMERNAGYEVHIVYDDTARTSWIERMEAIARSTVILGVHGDHLMDFAFMKRGSQTTLMELYPAGKFARNRALIASALGQQYVAWSGEKKYTDKSLPQVSWPLEKEEVTIDVDAVVKNLQQILSRA